MMLPRHKIQLINPRSCVFVAAQLFRACGAVTIYQPHYLCVRVCAYDHVVTQVKLL